MAEVSGGQLVAEVLARSGVEKVFMLHGAHVHPILVGLLDRGIGIVAVRHEAAAGHAAEGVARAGRRLGVARVTAQAVRIATTPPTGPVFLEIPLDVLSAPVDEEGAPVAEQILVESRL